MNKTLLWVAAAAVLAVPAAKAADEAPKRPWSNVTELGLVVTTGNSKNQNFSFSNKYSYKWSRSEFGLNLLAVRTKVTDRILSNPDGRVREEEVDRTTTELYNAETFYRVDITPRLYGYGRADWLRNRPSGIDSRTGGGVGVGYRFINEERTKFFGEIGVGYTKEKQVSGFDDDYSEGRGFLGFEQAFGANGKFTSELEVRQNLDESKDTVGKWVNAVSAAMSEKVALKVSYTILYDRQPVEQIVASDDPEVPDAVFTFDKTDTILTAAVVITY